MRLALLGFVLASCSSTPLPTPTETVCADPAASTLTWDNFGQKFMADYCTACHDSSLRRADRNGAPLFHDYDTFEGVMQIPGHIDAEAGSGPAAHNTAMPPARCPSIKGGPLARDCPEPSDAERTNLSQWIACERLR